MTEYIGYSPGGVYVVPKDWLKEFHNEFPDYRVRWSLKEQCWHIEQHYGRGALPTFSIDPHNDDLVRARDGYWLVMKIQPGDRMACPAWLPQHPPVQCGYTIKLVPGKFGEHRCDACRKAGRDGRTIAGYLPFEETLLQRLRSTNPLTVGIVRVGGKYQTRASIEADKANELMQKESERQLKDKTTSIDAVDYRWISGIASSTGLSRRTIDEKDLL